MPNDEDLTTGEEVVVVDVVEDDQDSRPGMAEMRKLVGFIIGIVLVVLAQRDLRKRDPELVRGPVRVWRVVALAPPGAVTYLIFGRRKVLPVLMAETPESIAA